MPDMYVDADMCLEHNGIQIFYVYRYDNYNDVTRSFNFSLVPDSRDSEGEEYHGFDIRDLPSWESGLTAEEVLRRSIERGELNDLVDAARADGALDDTLA